MLDKRLTTAIKLMRGNAEVPSEIAASALRYTIQHARNLLREAEDKLLREYEKNKGPIRPRYISPEVQAKREAKRSAKEAIAKAALSLFDAVNKGNFSQADLKKLHRTLPSLKTK